MSMRRLTWWPSGNDINGVNQKEASLVAAIRLIACRTPETFILYLLGSLLINPLLSKLQADLYSSRANSGPSILLISVSGFRFNSPAQDARGKKQSLGACTGGEEGMPKGKSALRRQRKERKHPNCKTPQMFFHGEELFNARLHRLCRRSYRYSSRTVPQRR
jgi:hypothetical protein